MIKQLGIIDIAVAIILLLHAQFELVPKTAVVVLGVLLLIKGVFFILTGGFIINGLDIAIAILIILSAYFTINIILMYIIMIYLAQKGIVSIIS